MFALLVGEPSLATKARGGRSKIGLAWSRHGWAWYSRAGVKRRVLEHVVAPVMQSVNIVNILAVHGRYSVGALDSVMT